MPVKCDTYQYYLIRQNKDNFLIYNNKFCRPVSEFGAKWALEKKNAELD